jgi:hypothetical protein
LVSRPGRAVLSFRIATTTVTDGRKLVAGRIGRGRNRASAMMKSGYPAKHQVTARTRVQKRNATAVLLE